MQFQNNSDYQQWDHDQNNAKTLIEHINNLNLDKPDHKHALCSRPILVTDNCVKRGKGVSANWYSPVNQQHAYQYLHGRIDLANQDNYIIDGKKYDKLGRPSLGNVGDAPSAIWSDSFLCSYVKHKSGVC